MVLFVEQKNILVDLESIYFASGSQEFYMDPKLHVDVTVSERL